MSMVLLTTYTVVFVHVSAARIVSAAVSAEDGLLRQGEPRVSGDYQKRRFHDK